jgi:hypothetical protein
METFLTIIKTILAILSFMSPLIFYWLGHTHGHRWTLKNPGKDHIEYFFKIEKDERH